MDPLITLTFKVFLAAVLSIGAIKKYTDPDQFRGAMSSLVSAGPFVSVVLVFSVPAIELLVAIALMVPVVSDYAVFAAIGLLLAYTGVLAAAFISGNRDFDCGCSWGAKPAPAKPIMLLRNALLLCVAAIAAMPEIVRTFTWTDGMNTLFGVVAMLVLYTALESLLALPQTPSWRQNS